MSRSRNVFWSLFAEIISRWSAWSWPGGFRPRPLVLRLRQAPKNAKSSPVTCTATLWTGTSPIAPLDAP